MKVGKFIGLRVVEAEDVQNEPLPRHRVTDEDVMEILRCERERSEENDRQKSKGKWY